MTAQVISLKVYKYRRYELDLPKRKAIDLALINPVRAAKVDRINEIRGLKPDLAIFEETERELE